ncbi:MAG: hypothetical protein SNJ77_09065 [Cytophagales bacterium]
MKIANPLYDHAFKYLMSNDRYAKKVMSTILEREVVEIKLEQQEIVLDNFIQFTLYRMDFMALIKDSEGNEEWAHIELQKSKLPNNMLRFRSYLSHAISKRVEHTDPLTGQKTEKSFPVISVYILGYNVEDIPVLAAKADPKITDLSTHQVLDIHSDFIQMLTNTCYVLQVRRLPKERQSRIEKFMTLFNQAWVESDDKKFILDLEEVPEEFKDLAECLQKPLMEREDLKKLEAEQEVEEMFAQQESEIALQKALTEHERQEKEKALQREEEERQEKEKAMQREEEERRQKEEAKSALKRMIQKLQSKGFSLEEIAIDLEKTQEEINAILNNRPH